MSPTNSAETMQSISEKKAALDERKRDLQEKLTAGGVYMHVCMYVCVCMSVYACRCVHMLLGCGLSIYHHGRAWGVI